MVPNRETVQRADAACWAFSMSCLLIFMIINNEVLKFELRRQRVSITLSQQTPQRGCHMGNGEAVIGLSLIHI